MREAVESVMPSDSVEIVMSSDSIGYIEDAATYVRVGRKSLGDAVVSLRMGGMDDEWLSGVVERLREVEREWVRLVAESRNSVMSSVEDGK